MTPGPVTTQSYIFELQEEGTLKVSVIPGQIVPLLGVWVMVVKDGGDGATVAFDGEVVMQKLQSVADDKPSNIM
mgnify:CR=1 FL=1